VTRGPDITAQWAEYAWSNDQRIASLTGQPFSENYHQLLLTGTRFDSTFMNRALTMVRDINPAAETGLLHALQHARCVGARHLEPDVVGDIFQAWAGKITSCLSTIRLSWRLDTDKELRRTDGQEDRGSEAPYEPERYQRGAYAAATVNGNEHMISGHALYGGAEKIHATLSALA
jgi:putative protein-disulfide isomerase